VYAENRFPEVRRPVCAADEFGQTYVPTVFENLITTIPSPLDPSKYIELALWDTAGQEDFDRLRPLSYNDTDVILVVFACNHRPSLMNVQDKVRPPIRCSRSGLATLRRRSGTRRWLISAKTSPFS
jgi:GTPase SAR1 family protein